VAGLKQWNKLGRRVKKGEKAIMIFAPLIKKIRENETDRSTESEPEDRCQVQGFRAVCVYDVSQTEGKELPDEGDFCQDFGGDTELLIKFMKVFGYKYGVVHEFLEHDIGGYLTKDNTITLNAHKSEEQRLKTLIHEIAHGELNHFKDKTKSRAVKELEAEITSFIVSGHFGVDSSCYSFGYLVGWSDGDISAVKEALTVAYDMANSIITQLEAAQLLPKAS
jgi:antirestriction protein ArdC